MRLTSDFHTHTTYTHGKSTLEENVIQADLIGLDAVAITEHSYKGIHNIKNGDLAKMRNEIESIQGKYKTKILLGIEANLISAKGDIDILDSELENLDLVVLGFHKMTRVGIKNFFGFTLPNLIRKKPTKKQIERNTKAYLNAMDKHRVSILAHLNYGGCKVNIEPIAKECVKKGIYIELNGKRINFDREEIDIMISLGVKFVIDSDAHIDIDVGRNHRAFNLIEKYKIPLENIANIDGKMPKFK